MNRWLLCAIGSLVLAGCSPSIPKGVIVTGKITKGGAPLTLPGMADGTASITVNLNATTPAEDGSMPGGTAQLDTSGAFRVEGAGRGIPPGKYRIQLYGDASVPGEEAFGNAYTGENYLKEVEVPADKLGGEFDLGTIEVNDATPQPVSGP